MADNRESRADELFEILNEFNDTPKDNADKKPQSTDATESESAERVDELLEILSRGKENIEKEDENDIPISIFGHLSEDIENNAAVNEENPHFSDHFTPSDEEIPLPEEADEEQEPEDEEEDDDEEDEEVSTIKKVGGVLQKLSLIPKVLMYIAIVVLAAAYLSYYIITIGNDVFALVSESRQVTITIEEGATDEEVADILVSEGIIEYGWVYKLYMEYRGDGDESTEYVPGEHTLNTNLNYSQIITSLTSKTVAREVVSVTIPEGYTCDQIIDLLVSKGIGTREKYIEAINDYPYKWDFVQLLDETGYSEDRKYRLEGYLFPDTYQFYTTESEVYVINKLLDAFNDKFWEEFIRKNSNGVSYQSMMLEKYNMTFDDIIVLASLVQSEGGTAEDFEYISYVFHNRLSHKESFPKLESDATIQYVLPERVDSEELNISYDSPYNTYLYDGLPPGAISNPGNDALSAAMFPSAPLNSAGNTINAYFFVSNNAGKTYYSSSRSGHNNNVAQVKKDNEAIEAGTYEG